MPFDVEPRMEEKLVRPNIVTKCYGCSPENPEGLKLEFFKCGPDEVRTRCNLRSSLSGWPGILHGGFVSMLLDETACWAVSGITGWRPVATVEMMIKFLKPVPVEQDIQVSARLIERADPRFRLWAEVINPQGEICATAEVTCVEIQIEKFARKYDIKGII